MVTASQKGNVKMTTLSELISQCFSPEEKDRIKGRMEPWSAAPQSNSEKPAYKYEAEVFNFLLANERQVRNQVLVIV